MGFLDAKKLEESDDGISQENRGFAAMVTRTRAQLRKGTSRQYVIISTFKKPSYQILVFTALKTRSYPLSVYGARLEIKPLDFKYLADDL